MAGVRLFSLQKGGAAAQRGAHPLGARVIDLAPQLDDFHDTAATMIRLDLAVTVDTAAAHLAGALGRPVAVLLPHAPEWRCLREREDSPWYPGARLFRQPRPGDWTQPVGAIAHALGAGTGDLAQRGW